MREDILSQNGKPFRLFWTVGFSGKRFPGTNSRTAAASEEKAAAALMEALTYLKESAASHHGRLTGVSSIARGGDVLFAQACRGGSNSGQLGIPWKCLLPFDKDLFLEMDLQSDAGGCTTPSDERQYLLSKAISCLNSAFAVKTSTGSDPHDPQQRVVAYLECGYNTVDESDVMICLLRSEEVAALLAAPDTRDVIPGSGKAGALSVARYAIATGRPCFILNADSADPWRERHLFNDPVNRGGKLFYDPVVGQLVARAADPFDLPLDYSVMPPGPETPARESVMRLQARLGGIANTHQRKSINGLRLMLTLHLLATAIAALTATLFDVSMGYMLALSIIVVGLAFTKPLLAFWAQRIEHNLHHHDDRTHWLHARELAELCRAYLSLWPFPAQPLQAADEEDFPKLKRLLRTLRIMRSLDLNAEVPLPEIVKNDGSETPAEARMRDAVEIYVEGRILDQAAFYQRNHEKAVREESRWHRFYSIAIWSAISLGGLLGVFKLVKLLTYAGFIDLHLPAGDLLVELLTFIVIVAPFVASYALGTMTILDCRRRSSRYQEMNQYLVQLGKTLRNCRSNTSRLRLVVHAERMMIEEQHEWFSVTRNYIV